MSIQFPDSPTQGDSFVATNGVSYTYDNGGWIANSQSALDDRYVNADGDTMTGDLTVPSLNGGPIAGFRNAIQNGGLDVWQRGSAAFSGGAQYTADRWFVASASATTTKEYGPLAEGTGASYALKVTDPTTICEARQNIEYLLASSKNNPAPFAVGKQYTISGWALVTAGVEFQVNIIHRAGNAGASDAVFFDKSLIGNGNWQKFSYTFTMTSQSGGDKNCLQVQLRTGSSGEMTISQIQLEPGSLATPFEHRPIATELSLCQRYFLNLDRVFLNWAATSDNGSTSPGRFSQYVVFPTTMRVAPTYSDSGSHNNISGTPAGSTTTTRVYIDAITRNTSNSSNVGRVNGVTLDAEL